MDSQFHIDLSCLREDINLGNIRSVPAKTVMALVDRIERLEYDLEQEKVITKSFSEMVKLLKRGADL